VAFRIRHKPTGRYLKKRAGAMWYTATCCLRGDIINSTTATGVGYLYAREKGARPLLDYLLKGEESKDFKGNLIVKKGQPDDWEIVEG